MSKALRFSFVAALLVTLSPFALAQSQRSAAPDHQVERAAVPSSIEVLSTRGGAMVFTDRAAFEAACGSGLTTETFEEANVASGSFDVVGAPLPPEDGVIFPAGSIEDGLTLTVTTVSGLGDDLFVSGQGFGGAPSVQVGNNQNTDDFFANFSPAVDCAGYDVDLNNTGTATTIEARDASGNVLGSATVSGFDLQFVGFKSDGAAIASVVALASVSVEFVDIDNVSFGDMAGAGDPIEIDASPAAQSVPQGGMASFSYTVTNNTAAAQSGVLFYEVFRGTMRLVGPVQVVGGTVQAGQSVTAGFSVRVPGNAPLGPYTVEISVGQSNGNAVATDIVAVNVTPSARVAGTATEWTLTEVQPWPTLEAAARTSETGVYPNPFTERTEIAFSLEQSAQVELVIYDVRGRAVATLADGAMDAGQHNVTFDASRLPSGVYVYRLVTGTRVETGRITLVK